MNSLRVFPVLFTALTLCAWALPAQAMNKAELINQISDKSGVSKADAKRALDGFINATTDFLLEGDRVALQNFGVFGLSQTIAASDGVESTGEVDFFAGAGFEGSEDAQRDAFKMRVESVNDASELDLPHEEEKSHGLIVWGPGRGAVAEGDIVTLLPGNPSVLAPGRAAFIVPLDLIETVRPFVVGDVNGDGKVDAVDVQLVINAALGIKVEDDKGPGNDSGLGAPVNTQLREAEVLGVIVLDEDGNREIVDTHRGETVGLWLGGVESTDIKRGMIIAKPADPTPPGIEEEKQDEWFDSFGEAAGGLRSDGELVQAIADATGMERGMVIAAYNALLNIIVDEVNEGGIVDLAGFGRFGEETQVNIALVDPCAGDPAACLGDIEDEELLQEVMESDYIPWEVTLAATGAERRELVRMIHHAVQVAKKVAGPGRNPQTGKEIQIAAKNVVKFKAGAELSSGVN